MTKSAEKIQAEFLSFMRPLRVKHKGFRCEQGDSVTVNKTSTVVLVDIV